MHTEQNEKPPFPFDEIPRAAQKLLLNSCSTSTLLTFRRTNERLYWDATLAMFRQTSQSAHQSQIRLLEGFLQNGNNTANLRLFKSKDNEPEADDENLDLLIKARIKDESTTAYEQYIFFEALIKLEHPNYIPNPTQILHNLAKKRKIFYNKNDARFLQFAYVLIKDKNYLSDSSSINRFLTLSGDKHFITTSDQALQDLYEEDLSNFLRDICDSHEHGELTPLIVEHFGLIYQKLPTVMRQSIYDSLESHCTQEGLELTLDQTCRIRSVLWLLSPNINQKDFDDHALSLYKDQRYLARLPQNPFHELILNRISNEAAFVICNIQFDLRRNDTLTKNQAGIFIKTWRLLDTRLSKDQKLQIFLNHLSAIPLNIYGGNDYHIEICDYFISRCHNENDAAEILARIKLLKWPTKWYKWGVDIERTDEYYSVSNCIRYYCIFIPQLPTERSDSLKIEIMFALGTRVTVGHLDPESDRFISSLRMKKRSEGLYGRPRVLRQLQRLTDPADIDFLVTPILDQLSNGAQTEEHYQYLFELIPYQYKLNAVQNSKLLTGIKLTLMPTDELHLRKDIDLTRILIKNLENFSPEFRKSLTTFIINPPLLDLFYRGSEPEFVSEIIKSEVLCTKNNFLILKKIYVDGMAERLVARAETELFKVEEVRNKSVNGCKG